ncbi:MAG: UDP-2,3-diacylglucosamine diphosphatase [Desulfobacterota bacterium]|nr:UDP-2,3-diacylglucosamine diphosphatase [Thermodesulfobacteriota bacterium]
MTRAYFIADIHLSADTPRRAKLLLGFCDMIIHNPGELYILGDLFEFWANNRLLYAAHQQVFEKLSSLTSRGIMVGVLAGNRDFLLSQKTLARCGAFFLGEEAEILLDGMRLLLAHGHTLCLSDTIFLSYRRRMWPWFRLLDPLLPGWIENRLAHLFMKKSKEVISAQDPSRFEFTRAAIEQHFTAGIDVVICGHTHKMEHFVSGAKRFYSLPCWDDERGYYLLYKKGEFALHTFTDKR